MGFEVLSPEENTFDFQPCYRNKFWRQFRCVDGISLLISIEKLFILNSVIVFPYFRNYRARPEFQ